MCIYISTFAFGWGFPSLQAGCDTRSVFKQTGLNSEFSFFPRLVPNQRLKDPVLLERREEIDSCLFQGN